jgi:peroxiredoxin
MTAWEENQGTKGSLIKLLGDTRMELTKKMGVVLDHPGPMGVLGNNRCQRFSMLIDNCVIKTFNLAASEDDPAGDDKPEVSMVDKMLVDLSMPKTEL